MHNLTKIYTSRQHSTQLDNTLHKFTQFYTTFTNKNKSFLYSTLKQYKHHSWRKIALQNCTTNCTHFTKNTTLYKALHNSTQLNTILTKNNFTKLHKTIHNFTQLNKTLHNYSQFRTISHHFANTKSLQHFTTLDNFPKLQKNCTKLYKPLRNFTTLHNI